jgi:RND family efflux transporter MFP subunit
MVALAGCNSEKKEAGKPAVQTVVRGVTLETAASSALSETLEVSGTVKARTSAVVSARIPGSIAELRVREGDRVRKGQLLARLDAMENAASAGAAVAGIDEARQGLEEAASRKRLADVTFDRYHNLYSEQAVTRQEFDIKKSEQELAARGVDRAKARLQQAREGSRAAATMAGYTRISAPIAGVIISKPADLGTSVFPGQPILTIEDQGNYMLELAVPESISPAVKPGTTVRVSLDSPEISFDTKISEVVPSADPASRTFIAKIALNLKGLRSGMFGRGAISLGNSVNSLMVPKKAVVERGALTFVWVVEKDGITRMRLVKPGRTAADRVEILSGLSNGERLVVNGLEKIHEGSRVE